MTANTATYNSVNDGDPRLGRESGVVEIVKREASPVTGAVEPNNPQFGDIEVDTEFATRAERVASGAASEPRSAESVRHIDLSAAIELDDSAIEVADDEIETAESPARPTQGAPSSLAQSSLAQSSAAPASSAPISAVPSSSAPRSRPPARPSGRPRPQSSSSTLPPPRRATSSFEPGWGSLPPSSNPNGVDPWLLANKTLELSRAHARIAELEEHVAFRDARILTLEEKLDKAQHQLEELERRLHGSPTDAGAVSRGGIKAGLAPKPTASEPLVFDMAKAKVPSDSRQPASGPPAWAAPKLEAAAQPKPVEKPAATAQPKPVEKSLVTETRLATAGQRGDLGASAGVESSKPVELNGSPRSSSAAQVNGEAANGLAVSSLEAAGGVERPTRAARVASSVDAGSGASQDAGRADNSGLGDDLRQISGIGPRFEAALRKHGVTRISQIAAWSEADVKQAAKALKIPKSRIVKGRWVESAREAIGTAATSE